jgi:hypothetical protein
MGRGGISTVHAAERAEGLLSTATSQTGYDRQLDTLHKEVQTILYGTQGAKDNLRQEITGNPTVTKQPELTGVPRPGATPGGGQQGPVAGQKATPEQMQSLPHPTTPDEARKLSGPFIRPDGTIGQNRGAATTGPATTSPAPQPTTPAATPATAPSTATMPPPTPSASSPAATTPPQASPIPSGPPQRGVPYLVPSEHKNDPDNTTYNGEHGEKYIKFGDRLYLFPSGN